MDLLNEQLQASLVLQEAEELIQNRTKVFNEIFEALVGDLPSYKILKDSLDGLIDLAIKYGRLQSIHEKLLSNGSENQQEEA